MILLQAAAKPLGPAAALLELVEIGTLELFVSEACLEEIREVLARTSLQRKFPSLTNSTVSDFLERIRLCSIPKKVVPSLDRAGHRQSRKYALHRRPDRCLETKSELNGYLD